MKRVMLSIFILGLGVLGTVSMQAADVTASQTNQKGLAQLDRVADFLEKNVMDRTLVTELHRTIAQGTIYSDFVSRATYHGLERTKLGLKYTVTGVVEQTLWDIDKEGKKIGEGRSKNRTISTRSEIAVNKATQALMGYTHSLSNTYTDSTGYASAIRSVKIIVGDKLELHSERINYGACFGVNNTTTPCASSNIATYSVENGKLVNTSTSTNYVVDPETFKKTKYEKDAVRTTIVKEK